MYQQQQQHRSPNLLTAFQFDMIDRNGNHLLSANNNHQHPQPNITRYNHHQNPASNSCTSAALAGLGGVTATNCKAAVDSFAYSTPSSCAYASNPFCGGGTAAAVAAPASTAATNHQHHHYGNLTGFRYKGEFL